MSTVRDQRPPCWTVNTGSGGGPTAPTAKTSGFAAGADPATRPTRCRSSHLQQVRDDFILFFQLLSIQDHFPEILNALFNSQLTHSHLEADEYNHSLEQSGNNPVTSSLPQPLGHCCPQLNHQTQITIESKLRGAIR